MNKSLYPCLSIPDVSSLQVGIDMNLYLDLKQPGDQTARTYSSLENLKELLCFIKPDEDHHLFGKPLQRIVDRTAGGDRVYVKQEDTLEVVHQLASMIASAFPQDENKAIAEQIHVACSPASIMI